MNIAEFVARASRNFPNNAAIAIGNRLSLDYATLATRVASLAGALRSTYGLVANDRVALMMANCAEYVEVLCGIWHAGLVAVPVNCKLHPREVAYILENSGARLCFVTEELTPTVGGVAPGSGALQFVVNVESETYRQLFTTPTLACSSKRPDEIAWLFYTSGTTGRPKGAALTHGNLLAMTLLYYADIDQVFGGDSIIHALPMSHGSGLYILPHLARAACNVIPESGGFDPAEVIQLIKAHNGITMFCVPTVVRRLLDYQGTSEADLTNLKAIVYGGAPMYVADLVEGLEIFGRKLIQVYGQGESPMTITTLSRADHGDVTNPEYQARLASAGRPYTGMEVRITDQDDIELPVGAVGEVLARGDVIMSGYWTNPEATAAALRGGWLHTGDIGSLDQSGFLTLRDRSKDVIISGGSNVYPREIEEVLLRHPQVREVSIVGRPHSEWGEEVVAFVVTDSGVAIETADLDQLCLENIARFKRPREYRFIAALPKSTYGKILKSELRRILAQRAVDGGF